MTSGKRDSGELVDNGNGSADRRRMSWFRAHHDMWLDPKWRVAALRSKRPVSEILAVAIVLMTSASGNIGNRGTLDRWSDEIVGAALDIAADNVAAIRTALQGLILDGDRLTGWDARQPARNDESNNRTRRYRERERAGDETRRDASVTPGDASVTPRHATVTPPDSESESETDIRRSPLTPHVAPGAARGDRQSNLDWDEVEKARGRAEGLGLDTEELIERTRTRQPRRPRAYFVTLAVNELAARLPGTPEEVLRQAISGNAEAYRHVMGLLVERMEASDARTP